MNLIISDETQQNNYYDCGLHLLKMIENVLFEKEQRISLEEINKFRLEIAAILIKF